MTVEGKAGLCVREHLWEPPADLAKSPAPRPFCLIFLIVYLPQSQSSHFGQNVDVRGAGWKGPPSRHHAAHLLCSNHCYLVFCHSEPSLTEPKPIMCSHRRTSLLPTLSNMEVWGENS